MSPSPPAPQAISLIRAHQYIVYKKYIPIRSLQFKCGFRKNISEGGLSEEKIPWGLKLRRLPAGSGFAPVPLLRLRRIREHGSEDIVPEGRRDTVIAFVCRCVMLGV